MSLPMKPVNITNSAVDSIKTINIRGSLCILASLIGFIILIFYFNPAQNSLSFLVLRDYAPKKVQFQHPLNTGENETQKDAKREKEKVKLPHCNIFDGKWVYNPNASMYTPPQCPFHSEQVSCRRNGRPEYKYENWSWEANECKIPRFNGTDMLDRMRGKRVIIVGDSLNRNQFESLICLLYTSIPSSQAYVNVTLPRYKIFKAKEYNVSVEFFWAPFLVELKFDESNSTKRVLWLDKIAASARKWAGADIMVFNSGHWWMHLGKLKAWDVFGYKGKQVEDMDVELAYKIAVKTWGRWIDSNVDSTKTTIVVRSISQEHLGKDRCGNQTLPITNATQLAGLKKHPICMAQTTRNMTRAGELKTPMVHLNITKMTSYRTDAHPYIFNTEEGNPYRTKKGDCSHWCLPGVPDSWNLLLYASMLFNISENFPVPSQPIAAPSQPIAAPSQPIAAPSQPIAAPSHPVAAPSQPIAAPV